MSERPASSVKRGLAGIAVATSLPMVLVAQRDLGRRPAAEIRGPKILWRMISSNGLGALAYLVLGRR